MDCRRPRLSAAATSRWGGDRSRRHLPLPAHDLRAEQALRLYRVRDRRSVDTYERKPVNQIEVASAAVEDAHSRPYLRLISTSNERGVMSARGELDVEDGGRVRRRVRTARDGGDLEQDLGCAVYRDCCADEKSVSKGNALVELRVLGGEHCLRKGEAWGNVDVAAVQREMIRRAGR